MVKQRYSHEDVIKYKRMMRELFITTYNPRSIIRTIIGVLLIAVGVVTSFVPFTSIPCYIMGGLFLGVDIIAYYNNIKKRVKYELKIRRMILANKFVY